jgi:hypothetical protein
MKKLVLLTAILLCAGLISHVAVGQVAKKAKTEESRYLQYEGVLTDASGEKKTGEHTMTFMMYDSPGARVPLWAEIHDVLVKDGEFEVTLGKRTPLPSLQGGYYCIGISINGEELLPRQAVTSSGTQAVRSVTAGDASAVDVKSHREAFPFQDNDWDYWTSPPDMYSIPEGNVGIGTMIPTSKFHVEGSDTTDPLVFIKNTEGGFGLQVESWGSPSSTASQFGIFTGAEGSGPFSVGNMCAAANSGAGLAYGNYGLATNTGTGWAYGVLGSGENSSSGLAFGGLFSTVDSGTGAHYGVQALSLGTNSSPMVGVHGYAQNNADGDTYGGFFEAPASGTGQHYGLYALSSGSSENETYGIYSEVDNSNSGDAIGGYFLTSSNGTGDHVGVVGEGLGGSSVYVGGVAGAATNTGSGDAYGGQFTVFSPGTGVHYGVYASESAGGYGAALYAAGDMIASGSKSAVVKTASGHRLLYAQESPEVWCEDFGEGQLSSGHTHIELDPLFLETVTIDENHPMKVFVQLEGDCKGTYVVKGDTDFDVYELQGGTSDVVFSYRVVAKRKGYEDERLRQTNVGHEDPTLYPELLAEIERESKERLQRSRDAKQKRERQRQQMTVERQRMEEERQKIQEEQRRMKQARLGEVGR